MKHDRQFWARHVKAWRASGLTQAQYCGRHRLPKGSLGYWVSTLSRAKPTKSSLVEVGHAAINEEGQGSPIELAVERRYLLRLWPGMKPDHLREVLSVLEARS